MRRVRRIDLDFQVFSNSRIPIGKLTKWLFFNSGVETVKFLEWYGIEQSDALQIILETVEETELESYCVTLKQTRLKSTTPWPNIVTDQIENKNISNGKLIRTRAQIIR